MSVGVPSERVEGVGHGEEDAGREAQMMNIVANLMRIIIIERFCGSSIQLLYLDAGQLTK
jgi:hypothetical protein